jgi:hypothetical protein
MNKKGIISPGLIILAVIVILFIVDLIVISLPETIFGVTLIPQMVRIMFKLINAVLYFAFVNILFFTVWYYISRYAIRIYAWLRNMFIKWDAFVTKVFK